MSDFVEQCSREWKRLGVPDPLAAEMAADLTADLAEAEAEGVSAEELLGSSFFDPRSFAQSWAAERGIIPEPPPRPASSRRRPLILMGFTALAGLTLFVAALLLLTGEPKVGIVAMTSASPAHAAGGFVLPQTTRRQVVPPASAAAPIEWILLFGAIVALAFAAWLWSSWGRPRPPAAA
jgi:hypothetical protein